MTTATPDLDDRLTQHAKHLDLLGVFHYVVAGLALLFSLFGLIYVALGGVMLFNPGAMDSGDPPPAFVGCMILAIGLGWVLAALAYAAFTAYAGRCLQKRRRYTLCLVSAAISCTFTPFGTVLGIFTILVLVQQGVRDKLFTKPA